MHNQNYTIGPYKRHPYPYRTLENMWKQFYKRKHRQFGSNVCNPVNCINFKKILFQNA